jgi:hypothetical protein
MYKASLDLLMDQQTMLETARGEQNRDWYPEKKITMLTQEELVQRSLCCSV